ETPVNSEEVEGVSCRFRTCFVTEVQALELSDLNYSTQGEGALLSVQLTLKGSGHLGQLTLDRLRLHFAGERYISQTLYLNMLRNLGSIEVVLLDADHKPLKPDG